MPARRVLVLGGHSSSLVGFRGAMLRALVAQGDEVVAAAPGSDPRIIKTLAGWGVPYRPLAFDRTGLNPLKDLGVLIAVIRLLRTYRPDLLFTYNVKPILLGGIAGRWVGVPFRVAMVEGLGRGFAGGSFGGRMLARFAGWLYRVALRGAKVVYFLNPDDLTLFEERRILGLGTRAVRINGIGVDLAHYAPAPLPVGSPTFLLIARLLAEKGVATFVEASRIVKQAHPEARFQVLGAFETGRGAITPDRLAEWQASGAIEYLGVTDDVRPFLEAATVFVLPSYYREGLPRTSMEAMAMGRAVVTTDWPGCREAVIDGHTGTLVPVRDPRRLAAALTRYIEEPGLAAEQGAAGRLLAAERFEEGLVTASIVQELAGPVAVAPNGGGE